MVPSPLSSQLKAQLSFQMSFQQDISPGLQRNVTAAPLCWQQPRSKGSVTTGTFLGHRGDHKLMETSRARETDSPGPKSQTAPRSTFVSLLGLFASLLAAENAFSIPDETCMSFSLLPCRNGPRLLRRTGLGTAPV